MRIMALADEPVDRLWGEHCAEMLSGIDLILSAGDLSPAYLSYLTCFTHAPIVYVHGNHDERYDSKPPEGCICADGRIVLAAGVRVLGLGGSMRYRGGPHMYTEAEMKERIAKLRLQMRLTGGFDILLTHAPMSGLGDQSDLPHRGFACFAPLIDRYAPSAMVHGHIHRSYTTSFVRVREYNGVPVINANGLYIFEIPDRADDPVPTARGRRILKKNSVPVSGILYPKKTSI